jgi:hypothetical protein
VRPCTLLRTLGWRLFRAGVVRAARSHVRRLRRAAPASLRGRAATRWLGAHPARNTCAGSRCLGPLALPAGVDSALRRRPECAVTRVYSRPCGSRFPPRRLSQKPLGRPPRLPRVRLLVTRQSGVAGGGALEGENALVLSFPAGVPVLDFAATGFDGPGSRRRGRFSGIHRPCCAHGWGLAAPGCRCSNAEEAPLPSRQFDVVWAKLLDVLNCTCRAPFTGPLPPSPTTTPLAHNTQTFLLSCTPKNNCVRGGGGGQSQKTPPPPFWLRVPPADARRTWLLSAGRLPRADQI